jgi:hypothetical protein
MLFDIYTDVSYHLKSQAHVSDSEGLELNAEIETGSGRNAATHR